MWHIKETELSEQRNEITVHIKWVKQATEHILHPSVWIGYTVEMLTMFAVNAKHAHGPMTPKLFPLNGLLCKQALWSCDHPIYYKGPFNQQNQITYSLLLLFLKHFPTVVPFGLDLVGNCLLICWSADWHLMVWVLVSLNSLLAVKSLPSSSSSPSCHYHRLYHSHHHHHHSFILH